MASIAWTDSSGAATLANIPAIPVNRFSGWTPNVQPIGPGPVNVGTGVTTRIAYRTDDTVALEVVPMVGTDLELAIRLKIHLLNGGIVTLSCDNFLADRFTSCVIAPDTIPEIQFSDRLNLEYTFGAVLCAYASLYSDSDEGIAIDAGQYINVLVVSSECSGNPEILTVDGPITGQMFSGTEITLPGQSKSFGPAPSSGMLSFLAWHQVFASGPKALVTWSISGGPYSAGIDDGFGDFDFNDIVLTISVTSAPLYTLTAMSAIPSNNAKQWRRLFYGTDSSYAVDNTGFTMEASEPDVSGTLEGSMWYWWKSETPLLSRTVTVDTLATVDTSLDTVIAAYRVGNFSTWAFGSFVLIRSNDNSTGTLSSLEFTAAPSQYYIIQVGTKTAAARGAITTTFASVVTPAPANDNFANRTTITGASGSLTASTAGATFEASEPSTWGFEKTVWYEWVAPSTGTMTLTVSDAYNGSGYAKVFTGTAIGSLTSIVENFGTIVFSAVSGTNYKIRLDTDTEYDSVAFGWNLV